MSDGQSTRNCVSVLQLAFVVALAITSPAANCNAGNPKPAPAQPAFAAEFAGLRAKVDAAREPLDRAWKTAKTDAEKEAIQKRYLHWFERDGTRFAERAVTLVQSHAAEPAAVDVLTWVIEFRGSPLASPAQATSDAADLLIKYHLHDPKTFALALDFQCFPGHWEHRLLEALAATDLPQEKKPVALLHFAQHLAHEARLPSWLSFRLTWDPQATRAQIEREYGKDYAMWLEANQPRLEAEAVHRFEDLAKSYGSRKTKLGRTYSEVAKAAVFAIHNLREGKPAPDFVCTDVAGKTVRLTELKGNVVLLDFWLVGCGACEAELSHLRTVNERYARKPFLLVDIKADRNRGTWEKFVKSQRLPWRHWYNGPDGVVFAWSIPWFPTHYVIDHKGILHIADSFSDRSLDAMIDSLVKAACSAERKGP